LLFFSGLLSREDLKHKSAKAEMARDMNDRCGAHCPDLPKVL
jgi:hypothetical protein